MSNVDFNALDFGDLFGEKQQGVAQITINDNKIGAAAQKPESNIKVLNTNSSPANDVGLLQSAQAKMAAISSEMNNIFVERDELIKIMQLAIVTGSNLLMLGPPGTAKSAITYEMCERIVNANYFQWMLNKTSDPSELLGPFSVKEMENDKFMRITTGKLPEAHIAFMDEVYKSNAPTLNALLTIMNEHFFYNDGRPVPIPLISMFGASNEPPEDESLNAMHDRFVFRMNIEYIHDAGNKKRMHSNYVDGRAGFLNLASKATITLEELLCMQDATKTVKVSKDIINKFIRLISDLERQSIFVSDRRQNECFKVMQGSAILGGRSSVELDDFSSLTYVLWEKNDHIPIIESHILKMINPYDDRFKASRDNFMQIKQSIESVTDSAQKSKKAIESKGSIEKLVGKVNKLISDASKHGKNIDEFSAFRQEMVVYNQQLINTALGIDPTLSNPFSDDDDSSDVPY